MVSKEINVEGTIEFATYCNRPNRFLVNLIPESKKKQEKAFLHDPGRMKELLVPNVKLVVRKPITLTKRKTQWDVLAVQHEHILVTINSSLPNLIAKTALLNGWIEDLRKYNNLKPEIKYGNSRLDFLLSNDKEKCYIEVKGVTLVLEDKALFPDAPTSRGARHLRELTKIRLKGERAIALFICMRNDPITFSPNKETDPEFSKQLKIAAENGVEILAYKINPIIRNEKLVLQFKEKIKVTM